MAVNIWERVKKNVGTAAGAIRGARDYLKGSAQNRLRENVSKPSPSLASKPPAQYGPPAPKQPSGMAGGGGAWGGTSVLRASPVSTGTEPGRAAPTYKVPQAESSVAAAQRPGPEIWGSPEGYGRGPLNMKTDDGYTSDDPSVRMRIALMQRDAGGGGQTVSQAAGSAPTTASVPAGLQLGQLRASVSPEQARIDALRKGYLSTLGQSEEERTLAEELAAFRESAGLGITGLEGQGRGIPLGLVRGQQEKLESQAAVKEQSYLERLGLAQSARQMEQQRAQAALGYAEQDAAAQLAAQKANAPIEIGGALVQLNPQTGQYETVYQSPASQEAQKPITVSAGQTVIDAQGNVIFSSPEGTASKTYTLSPGQTVVDAQGNVIASSEASQKTQSAEMLKLQSNVQSGLDSLSTLTELLTQNQGVFGRPLVASGTYKAAEKNLIDIIGRLRSGGAITSDEADSFKQLLPGRFETQETVEYKLGQIQSLLENTLATTGGGQEQSPEAQYLRDAGFSDDEIAEYLGFGNVPSTTQNGSGAMPSFKNAIARQESGGRYDAVGPKTAKGQRAYGKYQVMDFNIPSWTKEALGTSLTPQQFLASPEAQEAVADYKFNRLYNQYGNWEDVASVWFSGRPLSRAGNASDVTGTTVPNYVRNIISFMG